MNKEETIKKKKKKYQKYTIYCLEKIPFHTPLFNVLSFLLAYFSSSSNFQINSIYIEERRNIK